MSTPPKTIIKRYRRFTDWDYTRGASLFITITTAGRRRLFGRIVGGKMVLSPLGAAVYDATERYIAYNPLKWELMYGDGRDSLRVHEPLDSPHRLMVKM